MRVCRALQSLALISLFLCVIDTGTAQEYQYLEDLYDYSDDEESENQEWQEYLWELLQHPLDVNRLELNDLLKIPFLSTSLSQNIIKYRNSRKNISDLDELLQIDGMDDELLETIKLFLTVQKKTVPSRYVYRMKSKYEYPERDGFLENEYHNPYYLQHRLLFEAGGTISGNILWEKDAGETAFNDFASYHLQYHHPKDFFSVILGDFQIKMGNGLILWSPYGQSFSPDAFPVFPGRGELIDGNRSANETGYLRGLASRANLTRGFRVHVFYSKRFLDATLTEDNLVKSVYSSGLHRTETERSKIGALREILWGGILEKEFSTGFIQLGAVRSFHQPTFQNSENSRIYSNLCYRLDLGEMTPAGEIALLDGKYPAINQSLYFSGRNFKYQVLGYYYHPQFVSVHGRAPGSLSQLPSNRTGTAFIVNYKIASSTRLGGYAHFYRAVSDPEDAVFLKRDYSIELSQKFLKQSVKLRFRQKNRANAVESSFASEQKINSLRLEQRLPVNRAIGMQNRLELHWAKPLEENNRYYGINFFHQVDWKYQKKWRFLFRWSVFDVPDYALRIYEFEPDLPGNFRIVLLNGRGYKFMTTVRWQPLPFAQFDFKYQQRYYPDLESVGSGLDRIENNRVHEFRMSIVLSR